MRQIRQETFLSGRQEILFSGNHARRADRPRVARAGRFRLERLCATMLHRRYPRLTRPPTNLETAEMLGGVVEGLLKAMRSIRPRTVREFFALANQHMRWQLNDLARRLDERPAAVELREGLVPAPASSWPGIDGVRPRPRRSVQVEGHDSSSPVNPDAWTRTTTSP